MKHPPLLFYMYLYTGALLAGDMRVVLNEGMPQYKQPFDKGRLIIRFKVSVYIIHCPFFILMYYKVVDLIPSHSHTLYMCMYCWQFGASL